MVTIWNRSCFCSSICRNGYYRNWWCAAFGTEALIGSLAIGAGVAIVGGAFGYAVDGVDGILGGALAGFGIGAIVGFVVGVTIGYYNSLVKVDIRIGKTGLL